MTTTRTLKNSIAAFAITLASAGAAHALPATMDVIGRANPPIGAYEFCRDNPGECAATYPDVGPTELTQARWKEILKINYQVNSTIQPMTDQDIYGVEEKWAYPTDVGDCEDYALLKPVSYTHLDVYKRQAAGCWKSTSEFRHFAFGPCPDQS